MTRLGARSLSMLVGVALAGGCGFLFEAPTHQRGVHLAADGSGCEPGFGDCNHDTDDGCETDLATSAHCGACDARCANGSCIDGACLCSVGFGDCDRDRTNGCEANVEEDARHCGACAIDCAQGECSEHRCQAGAIVTSLASGLGAFAVHDGVLDFADDKLLREAPLEGTTALGVAPIVHASPNPIRQVAVAGDRLVVSTGLFAPTMVSAPFDVVSMRFDGSDVVQLVHVDAPFGIESFAVEGPELYWLELGSMGPKLLHRPVTGGSSALVAKVDAANQLVAVVKGWAIVLGAASVVQIPVHGGAPVTITSSAQTFFVTTTPDEVCLGQCPDSPGGFHVACGPPGSATLTERVTFGELCVGQDIVTDGTTFYEADLSTNHLLRSKESGGPERLIGAIAGLESNLQIVGEDLFWATPRGVFRMKHPNGR